MRESEDILSVLSEVTKKNKKEYKLEKVYRLLYNKNLYYTALDQIYNNKGAGTMGTDNDTIDGISDKKLDEIIESLKNESYKPKAVRRTYIPKKNGKQRPLGIPSFSDKLVQKVTTMILEAIYEPIFKENSHGFRPSKGCHTALMQIKEEWTGITWVVEGDIKGFFDNVNHEILINILRKKIKDERFLNLIRKFLKAGYIENNIKYNTYGGTPQGGIISPILANIYLHEWDCFIETKIKEFNKGVKRRTHPQYQLWMSRYRKTRDKYKKTNDMQYKIKMEQALEQRNKYPSLDFFDENFKRMKYVRYADDWMIGIIGTKEDADNIKLMATKWFDENLRLELSSEKTYVTNIEKGVKFLGYEIYKLNSMDKKSVNGKIQLRVDPQKAWDLLNSYHMVDYEKQFTRKDGVKFGRKGKAIGKIMHMDEVEIILYYNTILRGFYNYYKLASNISTVMNKIYYTWKDSWELTMGRKLKLTKAQVRKSHILNGKLCVSYKNNKEEIKTIYLLENSFKVEKKPVIGIEGEYADICYLYYAKTSLIKRMQAERCEICETTSEALEGHHVNRLKDLKQRKWLSPIEQRIAQRNRKIIWVCRNCHDKIHKEEQKRHWK